MITGIMRAAARIAEDAVAGVSEERAEQGAGLVFGRITVSDTGPDVTAVVPGRSFRVSYGLDVPSGTRG
jgi:hypothetical protein